MTPWGSISGFTPTRPALASRPGEGYRDPSEMSAAHHLLQDYLAQLAARGVTHVALDEGVRSKLTTKPSTPALGPSPKAAPAPVPAARPKPLTPQPVVPPAASPPAASPGTAATVSKATHLAQLALQAEDCQRARDLGTLRDVMVFATGSPDAEIMFIGEAPGAEEEKQREPFVGPAGQLLTKIIQAMGLRRSDVYISNICKFRPKIDDGNSQGTRNRAPTLGEMLSCQPFILAEINIVKPRIIIALGATASTGLGIEGTVGKLRGSVSEWRGTPLVVTYHPSYLLRREQEDGGGLREKRLVWEDMMRVMETIGLPISEKQRGYFLKAVK